MADKKKKKKIKQVIRQAGPVISKKEMEKITKAAGGNVEKAINRIASVQQNMQAANKPAPVVASGAANMLIKQAEKAPAFSQPSFGTSKLGQTLQSMVARPAVPGAMIKGQRVGGMAAQPGFNPGGSPNKNRMIGGTVIRPGGNIAVRPQQVAAAPQVAPSVVEPTVSDVGGDTGYDGFDMQSILDQLTMPEMPNLDTMFEELSSAFDTPDPLQLADLGRAYGADAIRARQRQRKSRQDYRRGLTNASLAQALAPSLMIGGGLTL